MTTLADEVVSLAQIGGWELDVSSGFLHWTEKMFSIHETTPSEYTPTLESAIAFYSPSSVPIVSTAVKETLEHGKEFSLELDLITAKQHFIHVETKGKAIRENGRIVKVVGALRDITKCKQAEKALKESEKDFRLLAESLPQIVWMTRPDGWNTYSNQQWVDYTGLTLEESYGHGWNKPFHPDDQKKAWDAWQNATQNGATYSLEARLRRADGAYQWWLIRGVPVQDENSTILKWFGTCTDIDQIKHSEMELRKSEENFKSALHHSISCIYRVNLQTLRYEYVSPACEQILGFSPDELIACHVEQILGMIHPDDLTAVQTAFKQIEVNRTIDIEYRQKNKSGDYRWIINRMVLIRDASGLPIYRDGNFYDITEHKQAAQNLLESKVTQAANEAKNQFLSQFLAMMSHEIRTPINAILGFSELITELDPMAEQNQYQQEKTDYANRIKRNGQLLVHLIDEILDLSKIESGKLKLEKIRINLNELISDISTTMQFKATKKGLLFCMNTHGPLPQTCISDPMRIKQILSNIIGNAIKFTSKGEVKVVITNTPSDSKLHVAVTDSGIGLTQEQACQLFQPFSQADPSISQQYGGTGLGLAISQKLAQSLGGDVVITKSQPGVGSTFEITIPLEDASYQHPTQPTKLMPVARKKTRINGIRVLSAEDMPDNQLLLKRNITNAGGTMDMANDGQEAVTKALAGHYDIILMDIKMPRLNGYEATTQLRAAGYSGPIIALTAHAMLEDVKRCEEVGCNAHLAKPVARDEMLEMIFKFTRR